MPSVCSSPSPTPAKLVVSVPFQWEEKPLQEASSLSLNPFVVEGDEEYALGFDLEAFGLPDGNNDASGAAAWIGGSNRRDDWYSFSDSEDYSNSSSDTSAQEFQFPRPPSEKSWEVANDSDSDLANTIQFFPRVPSERSWEVANDSDSDLVNTIQFFPRVPSERSWEVANDDDQMTNSWSPPSC
jgi:hypothetical protein